MPRIMGVNVLGALLAAIAMFFVGFVFYGLLFTEQWMAGRGYTPDMFEGASQMWMLGGFLIELALAFGLGWVMKARGATSMGGAIAVAVAAAVLFVMPTLAYDFVYGAYHSVPALMVDWGHSLVALILGAIVLSFFD